MKIRTRLSQSFITLKQAVMPLAENDRIVFLESLRNWYLFHLASIHRAERRGDGLKLLLHSPLDEIPVTREAVTHVKHQLARYDAGDLEWTVSAVDSLITDICVHRDWNACCVNDQFDLEYLFDTEALCVVKTCTACGYTMDTIGQRRAPPQRYRIALRSELLAAGVIDEAT